MPTITAIERDERRRGRVRVFVDGVARCELSRAFAKAKLRAGQQVTDAELEALALADTRRQAASTALALLARRARSEREVRRRLAMRRFPAGVIDETVRKLRAARLLDDSEYARTWAEARARSSPRSRRLLTQELRASGVDVDTARTAVGDLSDEDAAWRAAERRLHALRGLEREAFATRLGTFLRRRGFAWGLCQQTVERAWRETGNAAAAPE
jgi:regulatory protein